MSQNLGATQPHGWLCGDSCVCVSIPWDSHTCRTKSAFPRARFALAGLYVTVKNISNTQQLTSPKARDLFKASECDILTAPNSVRRPENHEKTNPDCHPDHDSPLPRCAC